ncbi:MAG: hypothetical protein N3B14_06580 [Thermoleophilia bacterium]|nr:hypothetical protein [Thermoleophilia bacterium]
MRGQGLKAVLSWQMSGLRLAGGTESLYAKQGASVIVLILVVLIVAVVSFTAGYILARLFV